MRGLLVTIVLAALVFLLISTSFQNFKVEGSSMEPTIEDGQLVVVNKAAFRKFDLGGWAKGIPLLGRMFKPFDDPERGDVLVFRLPPDPDRDLIKRVIGLPGETIEIRQGVVYINGNKLAEQYLKDLSERSLPRQRIPKGQYFVMGDNRASSFDSRNWGPLPRENIIGKAWFSYWPFGDFGRIRSLTPEPVAAN